MTQRLSTRHAHGLELEVYIAFSDGQGSETAIHALVEDIERGALEGQRPARLEVFRHTEALAPHAARVTADASPQVILGALRASLHDGTLRWLEIGLRGYGVIEGKREHRPWRRNAYLNLQEFTALEILEPEVRYHAPA